MHGNFRTCECSGSVNFPTVLFIDVHLSRIAVTYDPDTAHPSLVVSEDGKQVSFCERNRNVPNQPSRFSDALNVLAKEGFSSGKFYYEVQVKGKTQWDLGVSYESINREGRLKLTPRNGFWTMWLRNGQFTANAGPAVRVPVRNKPEKIGVFVDYDKGLVSFYNVEARARIYTFDQCKFTKKIVPFFCPCASDGGITFMRLCDMCVGSLVILTALQVRRV
uniref:B30.2/SPRY domain-containing protein n=1 Tax=Neogobius melanostomus TaxID=47308 RepID=A0A8C6WI97_9GOBI